MHSVQVLVKDLLRKYPQWSHDCIAVVGSISSQNVQEPKAKAALIWMLGEYSQDMQDAPYILESLTENWEEEPSAEVITLHYVNLAIPFLNVGFDLNWLVYFRGFHFFVKRL